MTTRTTVLLAGAAVATALALVPTAGSATAPAADASGKKAVTVSSPDALVEGDVFTVTVKVAHTAGATRILFQHQETDVLGTSTWETVKKARVADRKKHTFKAVAGEADAERFRARVLYADGRASMSKPVSTTVWHWTHMLDFDAYSDTPGVISLPYLGFEMNRKVYEGLYTTGTNPSWQLSFTAGRHCKAFRGDAGVTDKSAAGSSGAVQIVADDTVPVFVSGSLTPGMVQHFEVPLAAPYRLTIRAQRTSAADAQSYPALGHPELLCTGLG